MWVELAKQYDELAKLNAAALWRAIYPEFETVEDAIRYFDELKEAGHG